MSAGSWAMFLATSPRFSGRPSHSMFQVPIRATEISSSARAMADEPGPGASRATADRNAARQINEADTRMSGTPGRRRDLTKVVAVVTGERGEGQRNDVKNGCGKACGGVRPLCLTPRPPLLEWR